jgi:hypothetical protein
MAERKYKKTKLELMGYSKKQMMILTGQLDLNGLDGHTAKALLRRALKIHDEEHLPFIQQFVEETNEKSIEKRRQRHNLRKQRLRHNEPIIWKHPKSKEYTPEQIAIVRGEVPLESVHTNRLVRVCQKARLNGDIVLSEAIYSIIIERRLRDKTWGSPYSQANRITYNSAGWTDQFLPTDNNLKSHELSLLNQDINLELCSVEHLKHIIEVCHKTGDTGREEIGTFLLRYKEDPSIILLTTNHEEAIELYEKMTVTKLKHPTEWI